MKIIWVDNYDRERFDDVLIASNVTKRNGEKIANFLNEDNKDDNWFCKLVEDNYELFKFEI